MIYLTKALTIILALMVLSKSYVDLRKNRESLLMFIFWSAIWIFIVLVALIPKIIDQTILILGQGKTGIGTFLGIAFIFTLYIVYRVYQKANRIEYQLREINKKIAIKEVNDEKK